MYLAVSVSKDFLVDTDPSDSDLVIGDSTGESPTASTESEQIFSELGSLTQTPPVT